MSTDATIKVTARAELTRRRYEAEAQELRTIEERIARDVALERAAEDKRRREQAADEAVAFYMQNAPVVEMTFGKVGVALTFCGRDGMEQRTIAVAADRAVAVLNEAFAERLGQVRAAALTGEDRGEVDWQRLADALRDATRHAAALGAVEITVMR